MIAGVLEIQMLANMARLQSDMDSAKRLVSGAMGHIEKSVNAAQTALGALGIGLTAGYFAALTKASIDAADHLNDLTKSTNLFVETLAGLKFASKQSGGDLDSIAGSINKLALNMGKDVEKFKALGITAKDPLEAFKQLADVYVKVQDTQLRAALGAEALGKSWAGAAPLMAEGSKRIGEMVDKGAALSRMTKDLAEQSDLFNDHMEEIKASAEGMTNVFLKNLLPSLNDIAKAMAGTAAESGLLQAAMVGLGGAIVGVFSDQLLTRPEKIGNDLNKLRDMLDAELSAPKWLMFTEAQKQKHQQQVEAINAAMLALQKELEAIQAVGSAEKKKSAEQTQAEKDAAARAAEFVKTQKDKKDAYEATLKKADEYIKSLEKETAQVGLSVIQKKMVEAAIVAGTLRTNEGRLAVMNAAQAWANATRIEEDAVAVKKAMAEALDAANKALNDQASKLGDQVAAANHALETYGLTEVQILDLTLARLQENQAREEARDADAATLAYYEKEIAALKQIREAKAGIEAKETAKKAAEDASKAWHDFARDLESSLTDALMRSFEAGDSFGEAFADNLKNIFKTMILKAAVQITVGTVAGGVSQALGINVGGAGSGGSAVSGALDLLSTGSSLYGAFTGATASSLGGLIGGSFGAGMQGASLAAGLAGPTTAGATGAMGAGAMAASALPWVAGALALASIFGGKLFGGKESPPEAYINQYRSSNISAGSRAYLNNINGLGMGTDTPFGYLAFATQHMDGDAVGRNTQYTNQYLKPVAEADKLVAALLSQSEIGKVSGAFSDEVWNLGGNPNSADGALMRRFARISNAIGGWVDKLADSTEGTLQESYTELVQLLSIRGQPEMEKLANDMFAALGKWDYQRFTSLQAGVAGFNDMFKTDAERLADYTETVRKAFTDLNVAFPESRDGFKALVEGIDTSTKAGFDLYATLIELSPTMGAYYDALNQELAVKRQLAGMAESNFATSVDFRRYQGVAANYDPTFAGDYAYNIRLGAIQPGSAANADIVSELRALRAENQAQSLAIATNTQETAKWLRRWNGDGLPEERAVA